LIKIYSIENIKIDSRKIKKIWKQFNSDTLSSRS